MKLNVTVTKTSIGTADYIQIMSDDTISVNIVLVAEEIKIADHRSRGEKEPTSKSGEKK